MGMFDGGSSSENPLVGAILTLIGVVLVIPFTILGEKGDLDANAREIVTSEFVDIEDDYPDLYAAERDYLESLFERIHEQAFDTTYDASKRASGEDFNPNQYYRLVMEELIVQADADGHSALAEALAEEYRPFQEGWVYFETTWVPGY
ncbi:MAG: hypothetical protein ACF8PN_01395 [Phycisphaerales bacterium]